MSFGDILLLRKLGFGVLTLTGAFATLLGGWILLSAYATVPDITTSEIRAVITERNPTSLIPHQPYAIAVDKSDSVIETVTLGCLKDGVQIKLKSNTKQVRLKSRLCGGQSAALSESSIINSANGFVATLYNLEKGGFTSDYISLDEGTNLLMFEIKDMAGTRAVAEVTISRGQ